MAEEEGANLNSMEVDMDARLIKKRVEITLNIVMVEVEDNF